WGIEHSKAVPDILTTAKSIASGLPMGAAVYRADMDFPESGKHSNTFGGNPVACAASMATLDVMEHDDLIGRSAKLGEHLARRLDEMKDRYEFIGDRRGLGMMQATEFVTDRRSKKADPKIRDAIEEDAYKHGLILLPCGESSLRYIPALNIPRDVLDAGLDVLEECFRRAAK
ncbi:MAG: aminotransferase class III-fold pyridoxal phosphate-dependent enzyme, partial [Methanobacteriota archaeon]